VTGSHLDGNKKPAVVTSLALESTAQDGPEQACTAPLAGPSPCNGAGRPGCLEDSV